MFILTLFNCSFWYAPDKVSLTRCFLRGKRVILSALQQYYGFCFRHQSCWSIITRCYSVVSECCSVAHVIYTIQCPAGWQTSCWGQLNHQASTSIMVPCVANVIHLNCIIYYDIQRIHVFIYLYANETNIVKYINYK